MTAIDLKKLNRKQLLELLLKQTVKVEELEQQLQIKEQQIQELEQKLKEMDIIQQTKEVFENLEKKCMAREAEAERKIKAANHIIAEAEEIIAASRINAPAPEEPVAEKNHKEEKAIPEEKTQSKDIIDDFFSGVIGTK